jgi:N-acetylglucosaminyl-diphospho-decaprenol L-rhamnosyltransferase
MTTVAAVIGNFQGEQLLPDVLESLTAQSHLPVETVVVDAESTDRSVEVAEAHGAKVLREPNHGLGFLYNRGLAASSAEFVLFLNNDVALDPHCIRRLAEELERDETRFCADARQLDWSGETTIHARTLISRGALLHEYLPGLHLDHVVPADEVVATVTANGAAMMVRRSQFEQLGGFDETFFMEWEDLDLCWRAWSRGWPTVYVPDAIVRHRVGGVTTTAIAPRRSASSHHNLMRFALKCLPPPAAARLLFGELVRMPAHPRAIVSGAGRAAVELPVMLRERRAIEPSQRVYDRLLSLADQT